MQQKYKKVMFLIPCPNIGLFVMQKSLNWLAKNLSNIYKYYRCKLDTVHPQPLAYTEQARPSRFLWICSRPDSTEIEQKFLYFTDIVDLDFCKNLRIKAKKISFFSPQPFICQPSFLAVIAGLISKMSGEAINATVMSNTGIQH